MVALVVVVVLVVVDVGGFEGALRGWYPEYYRTRGVSVVLGVVAILVVGVGGFEGVLRVWYS